MEIRESMSAEEIAAAKEAGCGVIEYMVGADRRYMVIFPYVGEREDF